MSQLLCLASVHKASMLAFRVIYWPSVPGSAIIENYENEMRREWVAWGEEWETFTEGWKTWIDVEGMEVCEIVKWESAVLFK